MLGSSPGTLGRHPSRFDNFRIRRAGCSSLQASSLRSPILGNRKENEDIRPQLLGELVSAEPIEREIQGEHVHAGVSKKSEIATVFVLVNQLAQFLLANAASFGHAWALELGVAQTDVRIEAAAGCGHSIGWHGFAL